VCITHEKKGYCQVVECLCGGYRFPIEIISHIVWCYYRLSVSLRDIEILMLKRGIEVSHETINQWINKFGKLYAKELKKRRARRGDKWHVDEQCIVINGKRYWLWRAIDQDGYELDILVQSRRNTAAAIRFFKKNTLPKGHVLR